MDLTSTPSASCKAYARTHHMSEQKARRILINQGLFISERSSEIHRMHDAGMSIQEIAKALQISETCVSAYLPYSKCEYKKEDCTDNAKRIRKWRKKKRENK